MVQLGDVFSSMEAAYDAVQQHALNEGESYKTSYSNKKGYIIIYKDNEFDFQI